MNFKTGDKVVVIAGKDKGKEGKVLELKKQQKETIDIHQKEKIGMEIVEYMKKIQEMKIERSVKNDKIWNEKEWINRTGKKRRVSFD